MLVAVPQLSTLKAMSARVLLLSELLVFRSFLERAEGSECLLSQILFHIRLPKTIAAESRVLHTSRPLDFGTQTRFWSLVVTSIIPQGSLF